MDDVAAYNVARWRALAEANALFTRPALHLDAESARQMVDPLGMLGPLAGARVLCLASGGGQQSVAFAVLGAVVTVVDLSPEQLERDRQAAAHYQLEIEVVQADMRDLSALPAAAFDLVWQPYALNFVPEAGPVFAQVARVLRPGGLYHLMCANPFVSGLSTQDWTGDGYLLHRPYTEGAALSYPDEEWVYRRAEGADNPIPPPREYRHTLAALVNGLIEQGFILRRLADVWSIWPDLNAQPGSWPHLCAYAPPWLAFWAVLRPELAGAPA